MKDKVIIKFLSLFFAVFLVITSFAGLNMTKADDNSDQGANLYNIMLVMDASGSMNMTDPNNLRFKAVEQFVNLLPEKGNFLGGIVFAEQNIAELAPQPINNLADKQNVLNILTQPATPNGDTNIGEAIDRASQLLDETNSGLPSVIVLLSDGNTEILIDGDQNNHNVEAEQYSLERKAEALEKSRESGTPIYSICLNVNNGADINEMQQIASATGGQFQEVSAAGDLAGVFGTFYNLIYGTSTMHLVDDAFPETGIIEKTFDVPGLGVEEINIIVHGHLDQMSVFDPSWNEVQGTVSASEELTMIKVTSVTPGEWLLRAVGNPGDRIIIDMVYNTSLGVYLQMDPDVSAVHEDDEVAFNAWLAAGGTKADSPDNYIGYNAEIIFLDAYQQEIGRLPMELQGDHFTANSSVEMGTFFAQTLVHGNGIEKKSNVYGPVQVIEASADLDKDVNTPPQPVEDKVTKTVNIWPFKGGKIEVDLNTLATDKEDKKLDYKIVSSSFIDKDTLPAADVSKGDYTVTPDNVLVMDHFSLPKGSYTIMATDSGGLSCDVELVIKTRNIGLITVIVIGAGALIAAAIIIIGLMILLRKPFRGDITVSSYVNGVSKSVTKTPPRGRAKLSIFSVDNIGFDYSKAYFQASGDNYVTLITKDKIVHNAQETTSVRIPSGTEQTIGVKGDDSRKLYIRFESLMKTPKGLKAPKAPKAPGGIRGPKPAGGIKMPKAPKAPKPPKALKPPKPIIKK